MELAGWDYETIRAQPANWLSDLMTASSEKQRIIGILSRQPLDQKQARHEPTADEMQAGHDLYGDIPDEALRDLYG